MAKAKGAEGGKTPKADRVQITVTVNTHFLKRLEAIGAGVGRNRSELVDRAIESYVLQNERPPQTEKTARR